MISKLVAPLWRWWYKYHPTPSRFTKEEVIEAMKHGCNSDEALQNWDIYSYNN